MDNASTSSKDNTTDASKEEDRGKGNAGKRARVFDLKEILEETRKTAQGRTIEAEERRRLEEAEEKVKNGQALEEEADTERSTRNDDTGKADAVGNDVNNEDEDDDDLLPMLPPGFVPDKSVIVSDQKEQEKIRSKEVEDEDEWADYDGEGVPTAMLIPTSCEVKMTHGDKPVTALAFDVQGLRFVSGGQDYVVNVFEFAKMDSSMRTDKHLTPCECHVISALGFNSNGELLAIGSGQAQIFLLDKQLHQWAETVRGDQYLVDLSNTKGHTASVNCLKWSPVNKFEFLTCSDDGSIRMWNTEEFKELSKCITKHQKIIKTKNANGKRTTPLSCAYSADGKMIAAGCEDGSIQMWKNGKIFVNPTFLARKAHSGAVSCIAISPDTKKLLSRSLDGTLKLWDIKNAKKPLLVKDDLPCDYRCTDCGFSPRGEIVYTGTSSVKKGDDGKLLFFHSETFEPLYQILYPGASCIRIQWHSRMNQILVGLSDGTLRLYYDQQMSHGGALTCVTKPVKRRRQNEVLCDEFVLSPLALEMFQPRGDDPEEKELTSWRLQKYLRMRDNELRPEFRKPADMPITGSSTGGRVAASGGTLHSYVAQQLGRERNKDFLADTDVRASILRHAEEAEKDPQYINKAYKRTQPTPIFAEPKDEDEEDEDELQPVFKMPKTR